MLSLIHISGTKDSRARKVLEELQKAGAPEEILYQAHPHVGTDRLPQTVRNIREQIRALGGEVLFRTQLVGIGTKNGAVVSVTAKNAEGERIFDTNHVVLDVYKRQILEAMVPLCSIPFCGT